MQRHAILAQATGGDGVVMLSIETSSQSDSGYTLLTIRNYNKYQDAQGAPLSSQMSSQSSTHDTASEQPTSTNKNEKNDKNDKKKIGSYGKNEQLNQAQYQPGKYAKFQ